MTIDKRVPVMITFSNEQSVARVIVERHMMDQTIADLCVNRYRLGIPLGGSVASRVTAEQATTLILRSIQ